MITFKVGDIVEVVEGADYTYSTPGSWGVVVSIGPVYVLVDFKYTPTGQKDIWSIHSKFLKLKKTESKEVIVARKIATIYARQRARGIAHV